MTQSRGARQPIVLSIVLAASLLLGAVAGLFALKTASASIVVINGDWTVSGTDNTYDGVIFKVDGNVTIESGALLEIANGGLTFLQDDSHTYTLDIQDGGSGHGSLVLENSVLTTEPLQIDVSLRLEVAVAGTLILRDGSLVKHPGNITSSGDAIIEVRDSTVKGFDSGEIDGVVADTDASDDAPSLSFSSTSEVLIVDSIISGLYENNADPRPNPLYDIRVQDSATLTIIDSYVGIDYHPGDTTHNTISATGSSRVYIFNMSLDEDQSSLAQPVDWLPAFVTASSAEVYIHRWLEAKAADRFGNGVPSAYIESRVLPEGLLAYYPRNGGSNVPSQDILDHLGASSSDFNVTGSDGRALIPLLTEWINSSVDQTAPNSHFIGNYRIRASFGGDASVRNVSFQAYPALGSSVNTESLTVNIDSLVWPAQDTTYIWSSTINIDFDLLLDGNLLITGDATIDGSQLFILQSNMDSGRHYIMIEGGGSLTITNGGLSSNLPLVVYLQDGAQLSTDNATLQLSTPAGRGIVYGEDSSVISLRGGSLEGDLKALGNSAFIREVSLTNANITYDTSGISYLWDPVFEENVGLSFLSDDGDVGTLDFDIRNATVDESLNDSFVFQGTQYAQLTNVTFETGGFWWTDRISDSAKIGVYWWLFVESLDAVGTTVRESNITLQRLNPVTMQFSLIPTPGPDDLYMGNPQPTHIEAPEGVFLYRALSQERVQSQGWANSTYLANGSKVVDATTYYADANETVAVGGNSNLEVTFTALTPAFEMAELTFLGANGTADTQPVDLSLDIRASVQNDASIGFSGVTVHYYRVDVDANDDGVMDNPPDDYAPFLLGEQNITVEAQSTFVAAISWTPEDVGTYLISAVIDQDDRYPELVETNNLMKATLEVTAWPDLSITEDDVDVTRVPVEDGDTPVQVRVENLGVSTAMGATVELYDNGSLSDSTPVNIVAGEAGSVVLIWTPTPAGNHTITVKVDSLNDTADNTDFFYGNNFVTLEFEVLTKPDLELRPSEYQPMVVVRDRSFSVSVNVYNVGSTAATDFEVGLYLDEILEENLIATETGIVVAAGQNLTVDVEASPIAVAGNYTLIIYADAAEAIPEVNEGNNQVSIQLDVVPPEGQVFIDSPAGGSFYNLGQTVFVSGRVTTPTGQPIPDLRVTVVMRDSEGGFQDQRAVFTDTSGVFQVGILLPSEAPSGAWSLLAYTDVESIQSATTPLNVERVVPWYDQPVPFVNLPLWILLVILAVFVAIALAITRYMRSFGLGRLVECGECGAFISESASSCPKCGTEFEREMVKCSSCHAWIPADVRKCPECGVEFTTGKSKGADYKERMKTQYQKVVDKYRAEAAIALGHTPSEKEFQEWWRRQPTYVTYSEWLKEEEEMRKLGSKPCPRCKTLNSLTATVCHRCGALLSEGASSGRPPGGPSGGTNLTAPPAPPSEGGAAAKSKKVERPILKKIVKKPFSKRKS